MTKIQVERHQRQMQGLPDFTQAEVKERMMKKSDKGFLLVSRNLFKFNC